MRGHVHSDGLGRLRAWFLLTWAVLAISGAVRALGDQVEGPTNEPVVLTGDRVRCWDEGSVRWVLLEGNVAVLRGTEGLRGGQALARITPAGSSGSPTYRIEAYAEAQPPSAPVPARASRLEVLTTGEVRIQSHRRGGLTQLEAAPTNLAIRGHAFPPDPAQAAPTPRPGSPGGSAPTAPDGAELPATSGRDPVVERVQFAGEGFADSPANPVTGAGPTELPDEPPEGPLPFGPQGGMPDIDPSPDLGEPRRERAEDAGELSPPSELPGSPPAEEVGPMPILPSTRRIVNIYPRNTGQLAYDVKSADDGSGRATIIIRGGVTIAAEIPGQGTMDISADNAVIWTQFKEGGLPGAGGGSQRLDQDPRTPLEVYLEGNVVFRQDKHQVAGSGDQKVVQARQFYADLRSEAFLAEEAELDLFSAQLIAPMKIKGEWLRQYRPFLGTFDNKARYGPAQIHAERTLLTGSRFPEPGYRFQSRSVDLTEIYTPLIGPDGKPVGNPENLGNPDNVTWRVDAKSNVFKIGPVPVFYWPRVVTELDDLDPPLRMIVFRANNYFGQQLLTDWSMFKLLGVKKPTFVDNWNLDIDYLSYRGLAAGTELGWSGRDLISDLTDPYHRVKTGRSVDRPYFGYFDIWGLRDHNNDVLGPGPAVVTNGPPNAGKAGFQRTDNPPFQDWRGRQIFRHMQSLLGADSADDEDFRLQLEAGYLSDRNFLEQYYKRLFDVGMDQATLSYLIYQRENRALTLLTSANLQPWYTDSQFFPKVDYYRLGDSVLGRFTYWQNSGVSYANTHTDTMVNNPNIFAFQPFDPVSATSGAFQTGRLWSSHELALPLDLTYFRISPYLQGELTAWDNQYATQLPNTTLTPYLPEQAFIRGPQGAMLGRYWGAAGARFNMMGWKTYPGVESELLNLHGLAHKINFDVDFRTTYSNVPLNRIGIQDQLDDNTYEFTRRYFALTNYVGGVIPAQYDPRLLTLRRTISPITGTTDVQGSMETLQLALRQRIQTKRGPEDRRRVTDIMAFDLTTTYFPNADRDNFGKPFGLNQYNWEWFVGDRTSIVSTGWFEFWDVTGKPILLSNPQHTNSPFGLNVITTGVSLSRLPRGNVFFGYSVIDTGVISTSALNVAFSYWMSPKWYSSFSTSYDFGNQILLGSTFGVTRIGADFLTSVGLTVDPQRNSYMFGFELTPRLSPSLRFGSGGGIARFDPRFAPTQ